MPRNPLPHEVHSGERNLFLVRVTRMKSGSPMLMLPGTETALTVVSGEDSLRNYLEEELSIGPFRYWVARLGDIPEANFAEGKIIATPKIELPK